METYIKDIDKLAKDTCLTGNELEEMRIYPTNIDCFTYSNFVLFKKGNKRIILEPLPRNIYKIVRTYDFIDYN